MEHYEERLRAVVVQSGNEKALGRPYAAFQYRLPRQVVDAQSLETFSIRLDGVLTNLIKSKMSLILVGGLDQTAFKRSLPT